MLADFNMMFGGFFGDAQEEPAVNPEDDEFEEAEEPELCSNEAARDCNAASGEICGWRESDGFQFYRNHCAMVRKTCKEDDPAVIAHDSVCVKKVTFGYSFEFIITSSFSQMETSGNLDQDATRLPNSQMLK